MTGSPLLCRVLYTPAMAEEGGRASRLLDYISPGTLKMLRRWPWRIFLASLVFLGFAVASRWVPAYSEAREFEAVTGSTRLSRYVLGWVPVGRDSYPSQLAERLNAAGITWRSNWVTLHAVHRNAFGREVSEDMGPEPALIALYPIDGLFAASATEDELRAFVRGCRRAPRRSRLQRSTRYAAGSCPTGASRNGSAWIRQRFFPFSDRGIGATAGAGTGCGG